ncbi:MULTISPECIES: SDR family oxidoreductase [Mycolicibacterium]|jgi:NAD(P)-dependent dehydrogenase (short-subunit alcohol dehydrogenase family)|uniref:Short-chain dehydrogenase/reductase SDR n=1 Tax=Mycolicibacterium vanbaalenii (strain DSM 7251 / JCM 13017 / BCRC 16820 / KCTC 9966 / NRRL B-24157 / PYR-1) TaxID=350058 RepID=A1T1N3_MYCVP|nr:MULTISPECIES: SDR family oxidoreductase [Mycolicibacterium]ABM11083.1 short-chain dehydrogenase/reductase SDR [Mycolicibacterium vanbaalenii PYR-1]MCV7130066.1 SDR family oxidoreductase [Mycolicibacterium vanbaalenii PYR-1]QZY46550.1 SDR family oxidoreductase [Mycolicibacterium austroafricanum]WND57144.1 SDR family oxidoreductase [Mycolicibacterium vanbaalenii]
MTDTEHTTALVTGANRGLGRRFAEALVARGAKVYAAARRPETIDIPGVVPIQLDITDPESVRRAAEQATDVTVVINNAGVSTRAGLLDGTLEDIRLEMDTHYFGTLAVTRAFVPVIERNGGGAILNVLSVLSWLHPPTSGAYSAAKAAGWAMTDALRAELAPRGIHVAALHVGFMDTDMVSYIPADQKTDPAVVAELALDGLFAGQPEILADELTRNVKAQLSAAPA